MSVVSVPRYVFFPLFACLSFNYSSNLFSEMNQKISWFRYSGKNKALLISYYKIIGVLFLGSILFL